MTERHYERAPIVEAIFEVVSAPRQGQPLDAAAVEAIADELATRHGFSGERRRVAPFQAQTEVSMGAAPRVESRIEALPPHLMCMQPDGRRAVQVGASLAALNVLPPYGSFDAHRDVHRALLVTWWRHCQPAELERLGQVYRNQIDVPAGSPPSRWFVATPAAADAVPADRRQFAVHFTVWSEEESSVAATLAFLGADDAVERWHLQLTARTMRLAQASPEAVLAWHESVHKRVVQGWESILTDDLRAHLGMRT